jgi:hypothetical protein
MDEASLPNGSVGGDEDHELPVYLQQPLPVTGPNSPRNLEREEERRRVEREQELAQQVVTLKLGVMKCKHSILIEKQKNMFCLLEKVQ